MRHARLAIPPSGSCQMLSGQVPAMRTNRWLSVSSTFTALTALAALLLSIPIALAAAPPTALRVTGGSPDFEGRQTFELQWTALSNATYLVQFATDLTPPVAWDTVDIVTPTNGVGQFEIKGRSIPENSVEFFRLVLPQPQISSVEPAIVTPSVPVTLYVLGQCFDSNIVLQINGVTQSGATVVSSSLATVPSFVPDVPGTYQVSLRIGGVTVSSFNVICADAVANPQLVLQGPPTFPPAVPMSLMKAKEKANRTKCGNNLRTIGGGDETDEDCGGNFSNSLLMPALMKAREKANQVKCGMRPAGGGGGGSGGCGGADLLDCFDDPMSITLLSGEVQAQVVDLAIQGRGLDFVWARTYRSRTGHLITLDDNRWSFSYNVSCAQNGSGAMDVFDGAGRKDTFTPGTNGLYTCPEFFREGTLSNNVFKLTFADSGYWDFKPFDGTSAAGKLSHIVDRNGNTMTLTYDLSGRLAEIIDDLGRTNTVSYNSDGRLSAVTDFSGRSVTYQYYQGLPSEKGGTGDLATVTSPPVIGTPNGNDFPSGKTTTYTYTKGFAPSAEARNHLLLSMKDALGQTTAICNYDLVSSSPSYLCCTSMQRWTNMPSVFTYLSQTAAPSNQFATLRCIVNDPLGNVTECFYDARGRCVKLDEFTGRATPGLAVTDTVNRPVGKVRDTDPDFFECRATWNNDSLCSRVYLFGGQSVQCVYQSDFDKSSSSRKRGDLRVLRETASSLVDLDGDGTLDVAERATYLEHDVRFGSDPTPLGIAAGGGKPMRDWIKASFDKGYARISAGGGKPIRDWIKPSFDKGYYARGPRQTTSLDGTFSSSDNNDSTLENLIVPLGNGVAINVKGTGADKGRIASVPLGNGVAINVKGTGADKNRTLTVPPGDDSDGDLWPDTRINVSHCGASSPVVSFIISVTDPRGNVTKRTFDSHGNLEDESIAIGFNGGNGVEVRAKSSRRYNSYGQVTTITNVADANGYSRVDTFDYYTNGPQAGYLRSIVIDDRNLLGLKLTSTFECDSRGNLTRYVDPRTNDWLYIYNALDQCVRAQSPTNINSRCAKDFFYDANDNLVQCTTELRDAADNFLTGKTDHFRCDPLHRVTRIECAVDATHSMTNDFLYDGNDQCVLALGGDAVSGADPHQAISFQYDERDLLFREVCAPGSSIQSTSQWDYDANANPVRISVGLEDTPHLTTMEYDGFAGFSSGVPGIQGSTTRFVRKARVWILAGAPNNRISKTTDAMGNVTTFNYDANDNLRVVRQFGQTNAVPGTNRNIRLAESRYNYDALDRCVTAHDLFFDVATQAPIGDGESTTTFAYAPNGQCTSMTDDLGHVTTYTYDTVGWSRSISTPNTRTEFAVLRDRCGNVLSCAQTDISDLGGPPQVFAWTNVYDSLSRCVRVTDNVGNSSHCTYDSLSRIEVMFNPREYSVRYSYDLLGRTTLAIADLDGDGILDLAHDISSSNYWSSSSGQLLATTDSHGNTTSYVYDSLNRCTQVTRADTSHTSLVWSPRSNLIQETDPNGTMIVHTYDLNDRCISNNVTPGSGVSSATTSEQFAYDGCSRLVSAINDASVCTFTYDSLGRCTRGVSGGLGALTTYDSVGNRLSLTYPGGRVLTYAYDSQDRCTNIFENGASFIGFDYDGPERLARIRCANGVNSRIFHDGIVGVPNSPGDFGQSEISGIRHAVAGGSPELDRLSIYWDPNGNKALRIHIINGSGPTNGIAMFYDAADRLVNGRASGNFGFSRDTHYNLDQTGNRTNVTGAVTCPGDYTLSSAVPPADYQMNQYTTTPCDSRTYDENGNLATRSTGAVSSVSYTYDCYDRLVNVNDSGLPIAIYAYDALGRRISKTVFSNDGLPPVTTQFYYDGGSVIEERSGGVVTATYVRGHCFGAGQPHPQACSMRRSGKDYFIHTDDQGNALALSTSGGAVAERCDYDDYGTVLFMTSDGVPTTAASSSVGNVYCWGGLRLDSETGLQCDDGGGYLETASGRSLARARDDLQRTGSIVQLLTRNNPWSGTGPVAMKTGTVKFFNETKGFGRMKPSRNMTLKGQKILQNRMAGGGYWGGTLDPASANVVVGNFVGTVATANSAVTAR
jgi:YD repeat-containing protein